MIYLITSLTIKGNIRIGETNFESLGDAYDKEEKVKDKL